MNKIIDDKGRLFRLINVLDLVFVVGIVVACVVIAPYFLGSKSVSVVSGKEVGVYFTVEFPQTTQSFADKISVGDDLEDNVRGYYYGKVSEVDVIPATVIREDAGTGTFVESVVPDEVTVLVTVSCVGTESEDEIAAQGQPVRLGKLISLKGKGYAAAGYIIKLWTGQESGMNG